MVQGFQDYVGLICILCIFMYIMYIYVYYAQAKLFCELRKPYEINLFFDIVLTNLTFFTEATNTYYV